MVAMYVDTPALNFRSTPQVSAQNLIGTLYLCQEVQEVEDSGTEGWVTCRASIEQESLEGFVASRYLRAPAGANREKLIASVHSEWMRFSRGAGKEHHDPYHRFVGEMWRSIGINNLDGTDRDTPWSAAAISFMVRNAGDAYAGFRFAAAHSKFINQAIVARFDQDRSVPFWGFRLDEIRPQIGDIICRDNPNFAPSVDFEVARQLDSFRSHTDVVMSIDRERNKIIAIGGNVSDSVRIATYDLTHGNFADDTRNTFAILRNMTDQ